MPQRSPIIIGLLFAATLAVDVVAAILLRRLESVSWAWLLFQALSYAQVNLLAVWTVLRSSKVGWRWLAPFIVGAIAACVMWSGARSLEPGNATSVSLLEYGAVYWVNAGIAVLVLWILRPTRLLQGTSEIDTGRTWRFSIANLLILLTLTSLVLAILVRNEVAWDYLLALAAGNVLLLTTLVLICFQSWHWLLRLCASFSVAPPAALLTAWISGAAAPTLIDFMLIQVVVLVAWLELGPILPNTSRIESVGGEQGPTVVVPMQSR